MRNIDRLLAKKGWSGEEVGKALLASVIHDAKHLGEPNHKPLFSQEDFNRMESSLKTEYDYTVYGIYRDLYSAIVDSYNSAQGMFQQFYNGYARYSNSLNECIHADEALKHAEDGHPLILTQSQYNRYMKIARDQRAGIKESFISLLFSLLGDFVADSSTAPEEIREQIEATKKEPATNQRILSSYNRNSGEGYYQLPDGRRSDKLSPEEWHNAVFDDVTQQRIDYQTLAYQLLYYGTPAIKALYRERTGGELEISAEDEPLYLQAIEDYLGVAENINKQHRAEGTAPLWRDTLQLIEKLIEGENNLPVWHYYDSPPELTKYDILTDSIEEYNGEITGDGTHAREYYKEFKADYPALSSALEAYIKETVEPLRNYKPTQYYKEAITWGELAELGIAKYKDLVENPAHLEGDIGEIIDQEAEGETQAEQFNAYRKCMRSQAGIAILRNPRADQMDINGDYKEPKSPLSYFDNIDTVAESDVAREAITAYQENLLKPALRFIYSHNALMLILGDIYDIQDMEIMQIATSSYERQIEAFNHLIYVFYGTVYGDTEEVERKRKLIKEVFTPIDIAELKPTEEAKKAVADTLKSYGLTATARKNLKNFDAIIAQLSGEGAIV